MKSLQHNYLLFLRIFAGLLCLVIVHQPLYAATTTATSASSNTGTKDTNLVSPHRNLLLQFQPHVDDQTRQALITELGGFESHWLPQIRVAVVRVPSQASLTIDPIELALEHAHIVNYAELDLVIAGTELEGAPVTKGVDINYGLDAIHAQSAWSVTQGTADTIVAVLDSGVKTDHPELHGRLVEGYDFVDDDVDPTDESGHGTHIAGIIGAADDGQGMSGVCPNCSIMPVRVLNSQNIGSWSTVVRGILYAVDNNAAVINLSLGAGSQSHSLQAAIDYARQHDRLIVAAAGNADSPTLFFPAAIDGVLAVGATGPDDEHWAYSNVGSFIDVVAPGKLIYSTYHEAGNRFQGYNYMSGTSMATPYVSGLLALLKSAYPEHAAGELIQLLVAGVDDLGEPGWDTNFGYGRINAAQTMHLPIASASTSTQPLSGAVADQTNQVFIPLIARN